MFHWSEMKRERGYRYNQILTFLSPVKFGNLLLITKIILNFVHQRERGDLEFVS